MIISVEEAKKYITKTTDDSVLEDKLQALESLIRKYTNNNFQKRNFRQRADAKGNLLACDTHLFRIGDTIQVSASECNEGLYVITDILEGGLEVNADFYEEANVIVTKIEYPMDVKIGVLNMLKWDIENREKVGIQSESISRHSVTYFNMDGANSMIGYPRNLTGFLKPYMKARF